MEPKELSELIKDVIPRRSRKRGENWGSNSGAALPRPASQRCSPKYY